MNSLLNNISYFQLNSRRIFKIMDTFMKNTSKSLLNLETLMTLDNERNYENDVHPNKTKQTC